MATSTTTAQAWIVKAYPEGHPSKDHFELVDVEVPSLPDGHVKIRVTHLSVDPYMRGRLTAPKEGDKRYIGAFALGEPGSGGIVGEVIESKNDGFPVGCSVTGFGAWQTVQNVNPPEQRLNVIPPGIETSYMLGSGGLTGLTALLSIRHIGKPKAGETAYVSGAAGAVGAVAGQILKAAGLTVVGSAGTAEKVEYVKSLGFDAAWNYKEMTTDEGLKTFAPEGVDIYFDNVGGETLDTALAHMNRFGRIIACGAISQYNLSAAEKYGIKNTAAVVFKSLTWGGFTVTQWAEEFPAAVGELVGMMATGKITSRETVSEGFDSLVDALAGLFVGANIGKMIVKV